MLNLIPYPRSLTEKTGTFSVPEQLGTTIEGFEDGCVAAYRERTGRESGGAVWLQIRRDAALPTEAYRLEIRPNAVEICASEERGVIWALASMVQLEQKGELPCCVIEDKPRFAHRGVSLDCARHFFPAEEVEKVIEEISLTKLNVLHWHLSDDQGWRIESRRFPLLHETSGDYYTQKEIRRIVAFARLRGVEIIPEIDLPGHASAILAAYPQLSCRQVPVRLADSGGIYPVILCAGRESTFAFLEELLDEIVPLFPGERFHIGGDEAPKTEWAACPHCRKRMDALGLSRLENLQGYFSSRAAAILKKHGKRCVCWNETLCAETVPEDVQIQYWTLQHRQPMQQFVRRGGDWIYSDMFELYLDYPHAMTSLRKLYGTVPHLGKEELESKGHLLGMEACLWAEHIREAPRMEELLFPRVHALAEICWSEQRDYSSFLSRLDAFCVSRRGCGVRYTPKDAWDPKGRKRRREAVGYFTAINSGMSAEVKEQTVAAAAPNKEFAQSFVSKFFQPTDLLFLLPAMMKK